MTDINFDQMSGTIKGKGNKHGFFTFNEKAKSMLMAYLQKRKEYYPNRTFTYVFTSANKDVGNPITASGVNMLLKMIGEDA